VGPRAVLDAVVKRRIPSLRRESNLVGKPEGKRPLGRRRSRWDDNITLDLREIVWENVDWMHLAQVKGHWRAVVNTTVNLRFP
jgi:hypothetical protein